MIEVEVGQWVFLAIAALVVGISKTSISGLGSLVVAAFALVLPAKESTAAVLLLLICGDLVAVRIYHHQADWDQLKRLLPAVIPGIVAGALFMRAVTDQVLLICVAVSLMVAVGLQIALRLRRSGETPATTTSATPASVGSISGAVLAGIAAGFTTMVANAAGAVMSLYLLAIRADKMRFVATGAWFFLLVNLAKVPFSIGLGLVHAKTLTLLATLIPMVLIGTWVGHRFLRRLKQQWFEWLTIAASAASAIVLLCKGVL